jgi:hypothetical protein
VRFVATLRGGGILLFTPERETPTRGEIMTVKSHNGFVSEGSVVGYTGYAGHFYGYKLLREVFIPEAGYRWIGQYADASKDGSELNTHDDLILLSKKDIESVYPLRWTPGKKFAKGDVLVGYSKESGKRVVLLYVSEDEVQRLTPMDGYTDQGRGSMNFYSENLRDLDRVQTRGTEKKYFSEL